MDEIEKLDTKILSLNSLISDGEKKFELKRDKLSNEFFNKLKPKKPKKFQSELNMRLMIGGRKNYKGYLLDELQVLGNQFLNKNDELVNLLKAIRNARAALYQLNIDYNMAVDKQKESNKKYAKIELKPMRVEKNVGSSMPNFPWERVFKSKGF
ncbi:hypothetical protein H4J50_10135 [Colwellia sp. 6M3]|uniref:hypothetical protein n=1 Tax=Colwellia sp. 6M3 TaxID=2759849 RepID=UPI0015F6C332|nr:hypothetical protein [Colwellia sp. 6M3]MBA6416373.1 hypothetical protein [Colwellia sp. 6M3]